MRIPALIVLILAAALIVAAGAAFAQEIPDVPTLVPSTAEEVIGMLWGLAKLALGVVGLWIASRLPGLITAKVDEWTAAARKLRTELVDKTIDDALLAGKPPAAAAEEVLTQLPNTAKAGKWSEAQLRQRAETRKTAGVIESRARRI